MKIEEMEKKAKEILLKKIDNLTAILDLDNIKKGEEEFTFNIIANFTAFAFSFLIKERGKKEHYDEILNVFINQIKNNIKIALDMENNDGNSLGEI